METTVVYTQTLPSLVHNNEIGSELIKVGKTQNYIIEKVKNYTKLNQYIGFGKNYMITAKRLPPIPGGWNLEILTFSPEKRELMVNVKISKDDNGNLVGEVNSLVVRMIEEYKKEGLFIEVEQEPKEIYGNFVRFIHAEGHPLLLDSFEDFIENMR